MTKLSRWALPPSTEKELINQLWASITLLEDKSEVIDFLKALLMPSETLMIAKRIEMVKLHDSNLSFNDIQKLLHITKVTSYKWRDRYGAYHSEFKIILDRLRALEKEKLDAATEKQTIRHPRSPRLRKNYSHAVNVVNKVLRKIKRRKLIKVY